MTQVPVPDVARPQNAVLRALLQEILPREHDLEVREPVINY